VASFLSLTSLTSLLPARAMTAMSEVGSFRGSTGPAIEKSHARGGVATRAAGQVSSVRPEAGGKV
jgi:hypothetical protein